jgi:hypothetical protein
LGSNWQLTTLVDPTTGQIGITLYSTTAITAAQAGSLVNIAFQVMPGEAVSATAVQLVHWATPNGQPFETQVDDAQGQFVLSPGTNRLVVWSGSRAKPPHKTTDHAKTSSLAGSSTRGGLA